MSCIYYTCGCEILTLYARKDSVSFITSPPFFSVKGVNFYGLHSEFVVSGSDCGHVFLWDKETEEIVQYMEADHDGVVSGTPSIPDMLGTA